MKSIFILYDVYDNSIFGIFPSQEKARVMQDKIESEKRRFMDIMEIPFDKELDYGRRLR